MVLGHSSTWLALSIPAELRVSVTSYPLRYLICDECEVRAVRSLCLPKCRLICEAIFAIQVACCVLRRIVQPRYHVPRRAGILPLQGDNLMSNFKDMSNLEIIARLRDLRSAEPQAKQEVAAHSDRGDLEAGELLFTPTKPVYCACILISGTAEATSRKGHAIWFYRAGDFICGTEFLQHRRPSVTVTARTLCRCLFLGEPFRQLAAKYPSLKDAIYAQAERRKCEQQLHHEELLDSGKPARMVSTLLQIVDAIEADTLVDDRLARLPFELWWLTQDAMSDAMNMSRVTARKPLLQLRKSGALQDSGGNDTRTIMPIRLTKDCKSILEREQSKFR